MTDTIRNSDGSSSIVNSSGAPGVAKIKGVRTVHVDYAAMLPKWQRCRDVSAGRDAVHAKGTLYLPKLQDEEQNEYEKRRQRAGFYNATWRTISGMGGLLLAKEPIYTVPDTIDPLLEDITLSGVPLDGFIQQLVEEALTVGRLGLLVDYPIVEAAPATQAQAEQMGLRPMMALYRAESIINWQTGRVGNRTVLTKVVLTETATLPSDDEFATPTETRYRVLDLFNGVYRQRVYRINDKDEDELVSEHVPLMNGQPLTEIPFLIVGTDDVTPEVDAPPLIDLVDLNLDHYRVAADYENGCHMTALPTPYIAGYIRPEGQASMYIGSTAAWVFPDPATKVGFLEFSGVGLGTLAANLDRKEQQMATIGARMLAPDKKVAETARVLTIHRGGENAILSSIAQVLSLAMEIQLKKFVEWAGADSSAVDYDINRDYLPAQMDAANLTAIVAAWQAGAISRDTMFQNLQQAEIIDPETTLEDETAKIHAEPPTAMLGDLPAQHSGSLDANAAAQAAA